MRTLLLLVVATLLGVGCRTSESPSVDAKKRVAETTGDDATPVTELLPTPAEKDQPAKQNQQKPDSLDTVTADKVGEEIASNDENGERAQSASDAENTPLQVWGEEEHRERVVLLTPGGPLVVDTWITIAGEPHTTGVQERVDEMLAAADTNGDQRPTWKEWRDNTAFFASALQPNVQTNRRQLQQWVDRYDQNSNKRIEHHEAAAWLGRDAGKSLAPLSLRSQLTQGAGGESRLWQLLDTDASGGLDVDEMQLATKKLQSLDADDNRVLKSDELVTLTQQLTARNNATRTYGGSTRRHAALHFGVHFDSGRLSYLLADMYSPRGSLTPASFPALGNLFAELDTGGDGQLTDPDLARLRDVSPHVRLSIAMSPKPGAPPQLRRVETDESVDDLNVVGEAAATRVVLQLTDTRIAISAHDQSTALSDAQSLRAIQTQLMVHNQGDAAFDCLDENADGLLGEREILAASERLQAHERNNDGVLAPTELPCTMIVAFTRGEDPAAKNFYTPATTTTSASEEGALEWFAAADFNSDGDLSRQEFLGPASAFDELDTDRNGFITRQEAKQATADK